MPWTHGPARGRWADDYTARAGARRAGRRCGWTVHAARFVVVGVVVALAAPRPAPAQTLTSGAVIGVVRDASGSPLFDVTVTVLSAAGVVRQVVTGGDGRFVVDLLPPASYDVLAERLGYRPRRVAGVEVLAGRSSDLSVWLTAAAPPIDSVDLTRHRGGWFAPRAAGLATNVARRDLERLPWQRRDLLDVARLASQTAIDLGSRGLPGGLAEITHDGVSRRGARHPVLGPGTGRGMLVPLLAFEQIEILHDDADVEHSTHAGTVLRAHSRWGGGGAQLRGFAQGTGGPLQSSRFYDEIGAARAGSFRSGVAIDGSIVQETLYFRVGLEIARDAVPKAPVLDPSVPPSAELLSRLNGRAEENWSRLGSPFSAHEEGISGFGALNWQVAADHRVRAHFGAGHSARAETGLPGGGLTATSGGTDIGFALGSVSRVGTGSTLELNVGVERSSRQYSAGGFGAVPLTVIARGSVGFGLDPTLPGRFESTTVTFGQTLYQRHAAHEVKIGAGGWLASHARSGASGGDGVFLFADPGAVLTGWGVHERRASGDPAVAFRVYQWHVFAQDRWSVSRDLDLLLGVRSEREILPFGHLPENAAWAELTGLRGPDIASQPSMKLSPRLGVDWDVGGSGRFFVRGGAGIYQDAVDPDILAEVLGDGGGGAVDRWIGDLGRWPDAGAVPPTYSGTTLAILGPGFRAPRSTRVSAGIGVAVGAGAAVSVSGTLARTTGLPRRVDLNRVPAPSGQDAFGQPVYGELIQLGGLVLAQPGSNRRFSEFDHVWALHSDGRSRHSSVSVSIEHRGIEGGDLFGRYTLSRTTDDWAAESADPLLRAPPLFAGWTESGDRTESRSDLDRPHRVVLGFDVPWARPPVRLAGLYRYESGRPFTPGFPPAVDVNGDGVRGNEAAPIVHSPELAKLADAWPCLARQVGRVSERNGCREPGVHRLDVRLALQLSRGRGREIEFFLDGLNLLEPDVALRDGALYHVDPEAPITVDPTNGRVVVPLMVNERFGRPVVRFMPGRSLRLGIQMSY